MSTPEPGVNRKGRRLVKRLKNHPNAAEMLGSLERQDRAEFRQGRGEGHKRRKGGKKKKK